MSPAENEIYIRPRTLHIHPNLAAAKEFSDTYGAYHFWSDKKSVSIPDAALGKRNLIIGEPGVGKTFLLTKIHEHLNFIGFSTCLIGSFWPGVHTADRDRLPHTQDGVRHLVVD